MRLGGKKFFYCKKNEVKCQKHDRFSITILEVSPTSSSWFSAVSPLAASLTPSVCCAVLVSCCTRPALSSVSSVSRVSSACPSSCSALRSLSDLSSPSSGRSSGETDLSSPSSCSALRSLSDLSSPSGGRSSGVLSSTAGASSPSQDSEG